MAKTIGSLNVSMGLSITDFIQNLDKVKEDMGKLEAVTQAASQHFDRDVAGVMGDALHKFAKSSKLGADDALAFAVNLKKLGLDADGITSSLEQFGKSIGRFAKNSGEASKAFAGVLGKIGQSDKVLLQDIQALESMGVKAFDALAKELTKVEGKAVTTADVMKRISSGAISGAEGLKALTVGLTAVVEKVRDTNTAEYVAETKRLKTESDLVTKSLELQARQMNLDSGATKKLYDEMVKLEQQEKILIELENKAKGIVPPPKIDTNTPEYISNAIKLKSETDLATKALELQARQMNIDSGATKKLYDEMVKLQEQEQKIIEAENRARGIPPPLPVMPPPLPGEKIAVKKTPDNDKNKESQAKVRLSQFLNYVETKITSAASSIYNKVINLVTNPITVISGALASYGVYKIYDRAVEAFANTEEILTRIKGLAGDAGAAEIGGAMNEIANQGRIAQELIGKLATGFLTLGVSSSDAARMLQSFGTISQVAGSGAGDVFAKLGEISQSMIRTSEVQASDFEQLAALGLPVYEALAQRLSQVTGQAVTAEKAMQLLARKEVGTADALNAINNLQSNPKVITQLEQQANTLKGIYARLAGEVEGFFTEFGGAIMEALDLKGFSNSLVAFVQNIRNNFESIVPAIKNVGMILAVVRDVLFQAFQGLVNFFTTLGGADATVGNIDNIRSVVIQFAQGVLTALQSVMLAAVDIVNKMIQSVGGLERFAKIAGGFVAGAGSGALLGSSAGGIGALPGAIVGGITGAVYAFSKTSGAGDMIDAEAIKAKMNDAFKSIADAVGATGTDQAQSIVQQFIGSFNTAINDAAAGTINQNNMIMKINTAFDKMIDGLDIGITNGTMGHTAFLNQLSGGTATAIAMFKRQLDLGSISTDEFAKTMDRMRTTAFAALDAQLSAGTITNEEYGNSIIAIQQQFDALNPPDLAGLNAFMGGDNVPQWIKDLSKVETPLEIYRRKMEELQMALADRPDLFAAGAAQLADELEKSVGAVEALKNPGALLAGSAAAFSQVLKIQNAGKGENAADRLARIQQQALQQDRARNELLQQIGAAAANQNNLVIANF
jgi:hypothetical protein